MQEDELRKINNFILYIAKGHPQALEALYENIGGRMLAVAFSILRNRQMAEDAVQEVFLRLYTSQKPFESDEHLRRWLIRVTVNTCRNSPKW